LARLQLRRAHEVVARHGKLLRLVGLVAALRMRLRTPMLRVAAAGACIGVGASFTSLAESVEYVPPKVWKEDEIRTAHGTNRATAGARTEKPLPVGSHDIQLYSMGTPNGVKATVILEEICEVYPDFDYDAWKVSIGGDQFTSGFVESNPNSKIPAMVDHSTTPPTRVFESGAIIVYLAEKYPKIKLLPTDPSKRAECLSWLFWAIGSPPFVGGGFGHFYSHKQKQEYPINRYAMETKRQLDVLNQNLATRKYICGDEYTVADIAIWPWYGALVLGRMYGSREFLSVDTEYPHLKRWAAMLEEERAPIRRGRMVNRGNVRNEPGDSNPLYAELPNLPERHARSDWQLKGK